MKKLSLLLLLFITVSGLTSCIGNDDNTTTFSNVEAKMAFDDMAGSYTGDLIYYDESTAPDTVKDITVTMDSMIVIHNLPMRVFAKNITNCDSLVNCLDTLKNVDVHCAMALTSISKDNYIIQVCPYAIPFDTEINKKSYKAQVNFTFGLPSTMGYFYRQKRVLQFGMQTYYLSLDNKLSGVMPIYRMVFTSKIN